MAHTLDHHMDLDCGCRQATPMRPALPDLHIRLAHVLGRVRLATLKRRQRQALLDLDDHLLTDIGLTREAAKHEAKKPFWA